MEGLESSVVFEAAGRGIEIGGDLYDVLPTEDGCWVLIGDVAGKGSAAAGVSVALRHVVRGLIREIDEPEEVLVRVNELLLEGTGLNDFATAVLMRLRQDASGGWTLAVASAGHPPAVHVREAAPDLLGGGTVLGALNDAKVQRHDAVFEQGDTLVLCTDGWLEAGPTSEHRDPVELARLAEYLAPLALEEMTARLRGDAVSRARRRAGGRHRPARAAAGLGAPGAWRPTSIRRRIRVPVGAAVDRHLVAELVGDVEAAAVFGGGVGTHVADGRVGDRARVGDLDVDRALLAPDRGEAAPAAVQDAVRGELRGGDHEVVGAARGHAAGGRRGRDQGADIVQIVQPELLATRLQRCQRKVGVEWRSSPSGSSAWSRAYPPARDLQHPGLHCQPFPSEAAWAGGGSPSQ